MTSSTASGPAPYDPSRHYDRVTEAWGWLLGDDLHYGVFRTADEPLAVATAELTNLMAEACEIAQGVHLLDVGCGTGGPACDVAERHRAAVTGISTSAVGIDAARERAASRGLVGVTFELRDGTDNGYAGASFDRVWALESSHLMRSKERLIGECARVLRPGGRFALCDVMLRRPLEFNEVRGLLRPLTLLRAVFGDAHMVPLAEYEDLARQHGLQVTAARDLTSETRPTFVRWRANAEQSRDRIVASIGDGALAEFLEACDVLERFWDDGTLGYGLVGAARPD